MSGTNYVSHSSIHKCELCVEVYKFDISTDSNVRYTSRGVARA